MKDGKDKYGDFLRSNPAAYFTVIMFPLLLFFIFLISIVAVLSSGDTPISFGLIIEILFTILCGFLGIRGLVKFIRYFLDPEEREKRKSEMRRRIAAAQIPANYNPFASSAPAQRSRPAAASNRPNILERYRAARAYLDTCGPYDEEKLREMNRLSGNMFSEEDIRSQLAKSELMIGGMDALKKVHYDSLTESITAFEKVEAAGIDLSKYNV